MTTFVIASTLHQHENIQCIWRPTHF